MNALKYLFAVVAVFAMTLPVRAADDRISLVLSNMPPMAVINLYQKISGKPVAAADEISVVDNGVSLQIDHQKKDAALKIIEDALAKQAGIEIVHEKDGSLSARKIKSG